MAQPVEEFLRVEIHAGGDLAQLVELLPVPALQHVDEILHQPVVHGHAVQKHLEGVLARVGVRLVGRLRLGSGFFRLLGAFQKCLKARHAAVAVKKDLRQRFAVLRRAGPHKVRRPHGRQLLRDLAGAAFLVLRRQGDALRGGAFALQQLGHIAEIVIKKLHKRLLFHVVQPKILSYGGCICKGFPVK